MLTRPWTKSVSTGLNWWFSFAPVFQWCCLTSQRSSDVCFIIVFTRDLISIFHVCMVWIEKSVTRVTDRHHEAYRVMPNSDPE